MRFGIVKWHFMIPEWLFMRVKWHFTRIKRGYVKRREGWEKEGWGLFSFFCELFPVFGFDALLDVVERVAGEGL